MKGKVDESTIIVGSIIDESIIIVLSIKDRTTRKKINKEISIEDVNSINQPDLDI